MTFRLTLLGGATAALIAGPFAAALAHDMNGIPHTHDQQGLVHAHGHLGLSQSGSMTDHATGAMTEGPMMVMEAYARASRPGAPTGAAFMQIKNTTDSADRLIDVRSDIAQRVELHTHIDNGEGVMRMVHVAEGFEIAPGETLLLERGGKHVMFMGLKDSLVEGAVVPVTLVFQKAGEVQIDVPVDLTRMPGGHGHGGDS